MGAQQGRRRVARPVVVDDASRRVGGRVARSQTLTRQSHLDLFVVILLSGGGGLGLLGIILATLLLVILNGLKLFIILFLLLLLGTVLEAGSSKGLRLTVSTSTNAPHPHPLTDE